MQIGSGLDSAVENSVIVLDTCFAMQESFDSFLNRYRSALLRNRLLVPYKVVQEMDRILQLRDDREQAVARAIRLLDTATKQGIAEYRRDPTDDQIINDAVISRVVEAILPIRDVLVLTHDENLTTYLYTKTLQECFRVKNLIVAGVNRQGELFAWGGQGRGGSGRRDRVAEVRRPVGSLAAGLRIAPFALTDKLADSLGVPLASRLTISEGSALLLRDGSTITLGRVLAGGGEGTIYELADRSSLCKIYHQNKLTLDRQQKIGLMLTREIDDPMICWPRAAVYDADRIFRGFIMPRAPVEASPLGHSLFLPAAFLKARPNWTRRESVRLALTILRKIAILHDMNVLIGDINPQNILIKDEGSVFLVDCDSYQIEGYPCTVGMVNFTAPEIQGSDFRRFLRTREHELFSVATLLFMIFMPGKSPYSHQGGEDGMANIRKMHFPYALGERHSDAAPAGPWRLCWSHLPYTMKEAFNECFHDEHRGEKRISLERWLLLLGEYLRLLDRPNNVFQGPKREVGFDLSILPENLRRVIRNGEVQPQWLPDAMTDRERMVRRLVSEAHRAAYSYSQSGRGIKQAGYGGAAAWQSTPQSSAAPMFKGPYIYPHLSGFARVAGFLGITAPQSFPQITAPASAPPAPRQMVAPHKALAAKKVRRAAIARQFNAKTANLAKQQGRIWRRSCAFGFKSMKAHPLAAAVTAIILIGLAWYFQEPIVAGLALLSWGAVICAISFATVWVWLNRS